MAEATFGARSQSPWWHLWGAVAVGLVLIAQGAADALGDREVFPTVTMPTFTEVPARDGTLRVRPLDIEVVMSDGSTVSATPAELLMPMNYSQAESTIKLLASDSGNDGLELSPKAVNWLRGNVAKIVGDEAVALRLTSRRGSLDVHTGLWEETESPVVREVAW